jgi:uncharacterized phage protein gp47/JayE
VAFSRPTLTQLIDRQAADIESRLPGADARLRRSNLGVLAKVLAGSVHGLYGALDYYSRQVIVDTADAEYLERWAAVWGVTRKVAAAASGPVTFTGLAGLVVPAATVLRRADGLEYLLAGDVTLTGGSGTGTVSASTPGAASNAVAGQVLPFLSPVAGVSSNTTVAAGGLVGGSDAESDDSLRARLLARIKSPAQGGSANDYVTWALEVAGVTRAWVYPQELGLGTVSVRFMRDNDTPSAIPDAGEVAAVQAYIDARRPVTAVVTVVAPVAVPLNFTIQLTPNTVAARAAVEAELVDLVRREATPGGTLLISRIREAISLAVGESDHVLTAPAANVVRATGEISTFGVITWV